MQQSGQFDQNKISSSKEERRTALKAFLYTWLASDTVYLNSTQHCHSPHRQVTSKAALRQVSPLTPIGNLVLLPTGSTGLQKCKWTVLNVAEDSSNHLPNVFIYLFFWRCIPFSEHCLFPRWTCENNLIDIWNILSGVSDYNLAKSFRKLDLFSQTRYAL